jgi:hypothetical protein
MNPRYFLTITAALALAGCDLSSTAQDGTSSETQTVLQALADNAGAITARLGMKQSATTIAARKSSQSNDSLWRIIDSSYCAGGRHAQYLEPGTINVQEYGPGRGLDNSASSCSLMESFCSYHEFGLDSVGRSDFRGIQHQTDTLTVTRFSGSGTWDLRSGLSLRYLQVDNFLGPKLATFRHLIELPHGCQFELRMRDTLIDTGWLNSDVDAPVVCEDQEVGRFIWDRKGAPRILDRTGRLLTPSFTAVSDFPEDLLGIHFTLLQRLPETVDSEVSLQAAIHWNFLPGDTLASSIVSLVQKRPFYSRLDSLRITGETSDTITFRIPNSFVADPSGSFSIEASLRPDGFATSSQFPIQ